MNFAIHGVHKEITLAIKRRVQKDKKKIYCASARMQLCVSNNTFIN